MKTAENSVTFSFVEVSELNALEKGRMLVESESRLQDGSLFVAAEKNSAKRQEVLEIAKILNFIEEK
jgi:hypothetical protein